MYTSPRIDRPSFLDPAPLLAKLPHCRQLWCAWFPAKAWPLIWSALDSERMPFVAVHVQSIGARQIFVIASSRQQPFRSANAISNAEAVRLAALWLNLRRPEEVESSEAWRLPTLPQRADAPEALSA